MNGPDRKFGGMDVEGTIDKAPKRIGKLFDDITPTYDLLNHILSMSVDVRWRTLALDELAIRKGDTVLDIATGTGDLAILARSTIGCPVVGIDLSRNMLMAASRKWGTAFDGETISAIQGDALNMPFADGTFDRAMVGFGIRNMTDIGAFLEETHRILRPRGKLALLEFSMPKYPMIKQIYLAYLTKILPFIGGLQSGNRAAYGYLGESIRRFPSPESIEALFEEHRFRVVRSIPLTFGICHLYVIDKV